MTNRQPVSRRVVALAAVMGFGIAYLYARAGDVAVTVIGALVGLLYSWAWWIYPWYVRQLRERDDG